MNCTDFLRNLWILMDFVHNPYRRGPLRVGRYGPQPDLACGGCGSHFQNGWHEFSMSHISANNIDRKLIIVSMSMFSGSRNPNMAIILVCYGWGSHFQNGWHEFSMSHISPNNYTPLYDYLGYVWVVIYVNYITYNEGILHNTLALDVDTAQSPRVYNKLVLNVWEGTVNSFGSCPSGTWSFIVKAYAMVRRTVVVELNSDWLNYFTRTRGSGLSHPHWVFAKHSK